MDIDKIRELIELMEEKELVTLEIKKGEDSVRLTRHYETPMPTMMAASQIVSSELEPDAAAHQGSVETSPMVGVYYAAPTPNDPPFITPGQKVKAGDTLGIIEAMKIMNPLEATQSGIIDAILVDNGDVVQFGQPLVRYRS